MMCPPYTHTLTACPREDITGPSKSKLKFQDKQLMCARKKIYAGMHAHLSKRWSVMVSSSRTQLAARAIMATSGHHTQHVKHMSDDLHRCRFPRIVICLPSGYH